MIRSSCRRIGAPFLAGLMALAIAAPAAAQTRVKVGATRSLGDAGIFIGIDRGHFKAQGIEVELIEFQTALPMVSAVATGQIDVGRSAQSAGLFNSLARGIDVRLVADGARLSKGGGYLALALRSDLAQTIRSPRDLKGRSIAVAGAGGTSEIVLDRLLRTVGLSVADVDIRPLTIPDQLPALQNKVIDGAITLEPSMTAMTARGIAVRWRGGDDIYPDMQAALLMYSPQFARNADAARRFMVGYVRALRDYNDAFFGTAGRADMVKLLAARTGMRDPAFIGTAIPAGLDPDGRINVKGLADDQDWYNQRGLVKQKVDLAKFVDTSFAEAAAKSLGPYRRR